MHASWLKLRLRRLLPPTLFARLRTTRDRIAMRLFQARTVEHSYHGIPLRVHIADRLGLLWYDRDWPTMSEMTRLQQGKLRDGALVFDCGAHQGVVALILAKIVGRRGRVIALEANAWNIAMGQRNANLNPEMRGEIDFVNMAIASHVGTIEFNRDGNGQLAHEARAYLGKQSIPSTTLDAMRVRYGKPDVVFLDVEGAEALALSAAESLLRDDDPPDWFVEMHVGVGLEDLGGTAVGIVNLFQSFGFEVSYSLSSDAPFVPIDPSELPSRRFFLIATKPLA